MGFAIYILNRKTTSDNTPLGTIRVIVPKVATRTKIDDADQYEYRSLSTIISKYPDFPVEATWFCAPNCLDDIKNQGLGNTINAFEYAGETWELNNGSKVVFSSIYEWSHQGDTGKRVDVRFFTPSQTPPNYPYFQSVAIIEWERYDAEVHPAHLAVFPAIVGENGNSPWPGIVYYGNEFKIQSSYGFPSTVDEEGPFYFGAEPLYQTDDPYGDGGVSETGGGTGTFSDEGMNVDIPALPTISATDAGFITLFNPTLTELQNLASYMWSDLFDINGWKKVFADPMNAILGLSIVPVNVPASSSKIVKVGNVSTDISMTVADSQYVELDCGTLDVKEFWGAYLDYDPYTKAELYLPYIGTHAIAVDDIMGKSVRIVYHIDILSGACCAYIQCDGTVLYSFIGQCTSSIPITGDNWTNVINGALSIASSVGTMVATGGASAPMSIGQIASTAVNTMKPSIEKSGAMGGTGGLMGVQTPYLIITRPRQALPGDQNQFIGYPSFITKKLSSLSGYTEVESIHLENIPATESELVEIENLLNGGVIF